MPPFQSELTTRGLALELRLGTLSQIPAMKTQGTAASVQLRFAVCPESSWRAQSMFFSVLGSVPLSRPVLAEDETLRALLLNGYVPENDLAAPRVLCGCDWRTKLNEVASGFQCNIWNPNFMGRFGMSSCVGFPPPCPRTKIPGKPRYIEKWDRGLLFPKLSRREPSVKVISRFSFGLVFHEPHAVQDFICP